MTVSTWLDFFNDRIPAELSEAWDNDGLMCCPDPNRECRKIMLTLDVTPACVDEAVRCGCDLILSHHPMIFHPLKSLSDPKLISLAKHGISVLSFHTRLDSVLGGVNDRLASVLGLREVEPFGGGMGRIGYLPQEMSAEDLAHYVISVLGVPAVRMAGEQGPICRVAVLGGSGGDMVSDAVKAGADAYISGEFSHHHFADARANGILLIEAGHHHTENPVLSVLAAWIREKDPTAQVQYFNSDPTVTVVG